MFTNLLKKLEEINNFIKRFNWLILFLFLLIFYIKISSAFDSVRGAIGGLHGRDSLTRSQIDLSDINSSIQKVESKLRDLEDILR